MKAVVNQYDRLLSIVYIAYWRRSVDSVEMRVQLQQKPAADECKNGTQYCAWIDHSYSPTQTQTLYFSNRCIHHSFDFYHGKKLHCLTVMHVTQHSTIISLKPRLLTTSPTPCIIPLSCHIFYPVGLLLITAHKVVVKNYRTKSYAPMYRNSKSSSSSSSLSSCLSQAAWPMREETQTYRT